jgi:hypothetical protein
MVMPTNEHPIHDDDVEARRPLGISSEFEDALDELSHRDPKLEHLLRLFWRDISAYAIENGRKLDVMSNRVSTIFKVVGAALLIVVVILLTAGVTNYITLRNSSSDARRIAAQAATLAKLNALAIQTSRYDGSYRACQTLNTRHDNALSYAGSLSRLNPSAGIVATDLINVLAPLRDGKDGRQTCAQYATQQTSLTIPLPSRP